MFFFAINILENSIDNELYMNDKVIYDINEEITNTYNTFNISICKCIIYICKSIN